MRYRYHLLKYSGPTSRLTCPSCGRSHCFVPYVDDDDRIIGNEYGRCDHESSCGYNKYPPSIRDLRGSISEYQKPIGKSKKRIISHLEKKEEPPGRIWTIPRAIYLNTVRTQPLSDFHYFLLSIFDVKSIERIIVEYLLGVTDEGDIIYYQIDKENRCRTGKVMKYDRKTGHRIKDSTRPGAITWVHTKLKEQGILPEEWELTQCLFGEHLLQKYPSKPVFLVEAEKTAVIGSAVFPDVIWIAVGGKSQLGDKIEVLRGRQVIAFPDYDGYQTWAEKTKERPYLNIRVSDIILKHATEKDKEMGADIADILIRWILKN